MTKHDDLNRQLLVALAEQPEKLEHLDEGYVEGQRPGPASLLGAYLGKPYSDHPDDSFGTHRVEPVTPRGWHIWNRAVEHLVEIDRAECMRLLEERRLGRIAVLVRSHPVVFPVNYALVDGAILLCIREGGDLDRATSNRRCP